jgi:hypothetical protein
MRNRALLCVGMLSGMLCLSGCGSDSGTTSPPKDAAAEPGKQDAAPANPDVADSLGCKCGDVNAPANPDVADAPPQQPEAADAPSPPDSPPPPVDAPSPQDASQPLETARPDTAQPDTGPIDGVRPETLAIDGKPADTAPPPVDGGVTEAGQSDAVTSLPALFSTSPCKKSAAASTTTGPGASLRVIDNQAGLEGLECVAWERGSTDTLIDLFNFDGACGASWTGDGAVAADGSVKLTVDNPGCMIASCGICMYDWSFTLRSSIPANQTVPLSIQVSPCPGSSTDTTTASIGAAKSGINCTFAHYGALAWHAMAKGLCGKAGMPCQGASLCGSGSPSSTGTCATGLVCDSSAAPNEPRCLVPCQNDTDCPRTDVWSCRSGLCRPRS